MLEEAVRFPNKVDRSNKLRNVMSEFKINQGSKRTHLFCQPEVNRKIE